MLWDRSERISHGHASSGYREGQNLITHERHAEGDRARLQSLAAELVSARIEVIIAVGTDATEAAREITSSIPIVMAGVGDPLASGFAASSARPGGNMTGIAIWGDEAAQKQLETLREAAPQIRRVGVLRLRSSADDRRFERLEDTAAPLGLSLIGAEVANADDLPTRFADLISSGAEACVVLANPSLDDLGSNRRAWASPQTPWGGAPAVLCPGAPPPQLRAKPY